MRSGSKGNEKKRKRKRKRRVDHLPINITYVRGPFVPQIIMNQHLRHIKDEIKRMIEQTVARERERRGGGGSKRIRQCLFYIRVADL